MTAYAVFRSLVTYFPSDPWYPENQGRQGHRPIGVHRFLPSPRGDNSLNPCIYPLSLPYWCLTLSQFINFPQVPRLILRTLDLHSNRDLYDTLRITLLSGKSWLNWSVVTLENYFLLTHLVHKNVCLTRFMRKTALFGFNISRCSLIARCKPKELITYWINNKYVHFNRCACGKCEVRQELLRLRYDVILLTRVCVRN